MSVNFVGDAIKLRRKFFDSGLDEENVRRPALRRFAMNLLGDFLQRARLRVYPDVEPIRMSPGQLVNKVPVARPQVYNHASAGRAQ